MKFCIILLIVCIQYITCCLLNVTNNLFSECPYNLFRRKRAINEYTRWRANLETTPEFVVQVLDEDLTTSATKIVAVNIQPHTTKEEKIIIGGAMVPLSTTTLNPLNLPIDYTRFVPPTTISSPGDREIYIAPVIKALAMDNTIDQSVPVMGPRKNVNRDESPPADPQFLPRTGIAARQYAPIVPVGFTHITASYAPLTPGIKASNGPIRTTTQTPATRTTIDKVFWKSQTKNYLEKDFFSVDYAARATLPKKLNKAQEFDDSMNSSGNVIIKKNEDKSVKNSKDVDLYMDDDEGDDKKRKLNKILDDIYMDRGKEQDNSLDDIITSSQLTERPEEIIATTLENKSESDEEIENDSNTLSDNRTVKTTTPEIIVNSTKHISRKKGMQTCSLIRLRTLSFNAPRTLPEIVAQLKKWSETSPVAKWVDITYGNLTIMENPIYMMIIDDPSSGQIVSAKQTVMIVGGIQGRDHHAVASAMYVLYQLIEKTDDHFDILSKYRFWIIPVFNPDGYDYSMTFPQRREWVKNLHQTWDMCKNREACALCKKSGILCTTKPCYGVNLDRNFEYQWISAAELRLEHPCGNLYAGPRQLSEPETRAFTNFLHSRPKQLHAFIAFKEGPTLGVMYPYSHTKKKRSQDYTMRQRARRAADAARSISGRPYVAGQTSEFLPLYAGGIEDWVDSHLGIEDTFTIMMFRPTDFYSAVQITERVVHEAYAAMDTLLIQGLEPMVAARRLSVSPVSLRRASNDAKTLQPSTLYNILYLYISLHLIRLKCG